MLARLKQWAANLKREIVALWFANRDPRTPLAIRLFAVLVIAYALSPIDLIPDFIPVLGFLDELILLPVALWIILRFMPTEVMASARRQADGWLAAGNCAPRSVLGLMVVIVLWLLILWFAWWAWRQMLLD
ncbi:MAG: YkvA family protein [Burkholderiales bacterium]